MNKKSIKNNKKNFLRVNIKNMRSKDQLILEKLYNDIHTETDIEFINECNETCLYVLNEKLELTPEEIETTEKLKKALPRLSLMSVMADPKTLKSLYDKRSGSQYITGILYIAPAKEGGVDVCVGSSGCCRIGCLDQLPQR